MDNCFKRFLSLVMAVLMVVSYVPAEAFATEIVEVDSTVHEHTYEESIIAEATCTEAGTVSYTCSCEDSYTEEIPANGHDFVDGACTVCGEADPNYIPPTEETEAPEVEETEAPEVEETEAPEVEETEAPEVEETEAATEATEAPVVEETEAAEVPEVETDVELNFNGTEHDEAAGDPVAMVGDVAYTDIQEAIKAAAPAGTVTLLSDVTVDEWVMFAEKMTIGDGTLITLNINGMIIDGGDHKLTINNIESAGNGGYLFYDAENLTVKDLTINVADGLVGGIGLQSGEINNVTINGGKYGVLPGSGEVTVTGCTFNNTTGYAVYFETARDNLVVTGNTFNTAAGGYAITMRGQETFTNNTVTTGKVNLSDSASGIVSGNDFGTERFKVYNGATATISNNKIDNLVFNDESTVNSIFTENTLSEEAQAVHDAAKWPVAKIGDTLYGTIAEAIAAAQNDDTVVILPGEYGAINISNKNITIAGTVGENGELLTTIKGGNPAITGHYFNGTIKDIKIVDAWKVMYAEPAGNVTVDNVYVTGVTYGFHLVAYSEGLTWKIQNSYMDLNWANSFGVAYDGDAEIIIQGNKFESTAPYYPDYGALPVNTFLPNVTVQENVFGEKTKIALGVTDTSKVDISKNYHADGVDNAFANDSDATVYIAEYYTDAAKTELVKRYAQIGEKYYASLAEAAAAAQAGDEIVLLTDVEESITSFENVTLTTNVAGGVTITNTYADDYVNFNNVTVKSGITLNIPKVYSSGSNSENVIEGTLNVGSTYYHSSNANTTIQNGGKVTTGGMTVLRYNSDAEAGIYIYGDGNAETVEFSCANTIGAYSGTFYAKDAVVEGNMLWLDYKKDNNEESDTYTQINAQFENSVLNVTSELRLYKDATLTLTNSAVTAGKVQIRQDATPAVTVDSESSIKAAAVENLSGAKLNAVLGDDGTVTFEKIILGTGTEADPYLITSVADLITFQDNVDSQATDGSNQYAGKYFKLTADLDLGGINWNPIGTMSGDHGSFKGVFDGDGHTIYNLNVQQAGNGLGLFARTAGNAEIRNLNLHNVTVKSTDNSNYVGGLVGNSYASTKITNVHVTGNVDISGRGYIGGISGHGYVVMDNVSVVGTGTISSTFWCAGGILGYAGEGATNIMNAHVEGITITSAAGGLGAIVGMAEDNNGTQPISGSNLSAKDVEIKTYTGAYGDAYANYALGYLYGGNPTSKLIGDLSVENVKVETSSGETPEIVDAVATIGDKLYFNLEAALNAGGVVNLLRDVPLYKSAAVAEGVDVTLNLNGFAVTNASGYAIDNAGSLTIEGNGTVGAVTNSGELYINAGTFTANNDTVVNAASGNVEIYGGTFTGALVETNDGDISVYGGTFDRAVPAACCGYGYIPKENGDGTFGVKIENEASITDDNGRTKFYKSLAAAVEAAKEGQTIILGGNITVNEVLTIDKNITIADYDQRSITFGENGAFHVTDSNELILDRVKVIDGKIYADSVEAGAKVNGQQITGIATQKSALTFDGTILTLTNPEWVAMVGTTYYTALAEAVAAGGEVNLLRDFALAETVKVNGTVVLNLNGKTITGTDNATGNFALIEIQPAADLTIKGEGKITLTATTDRDFKNYSSVISNQRGKLTVDGGTIEHLGGTDMAYGIDNLTNGKGTYAETIINGGTIKSTYRGIRQFLNGVEAQNILTVNGGTIEGANKSIWMQDPSKNANTGKLTVGESANLKGDVYLYVTEGSTEWPVEVSIAAAALKDGTQVITGNVPAGYELINDNGTYGVKSGAAKIGNTYYATLAEAFAAIGDGDVVIELLNDVAMDYGARSAFGTDATTSVTINGNGYTMTLNQTDSNWSSMGLKNADAKLVLNNMTVEKTGYGDTSGTWNTHAIIFSCNVEMTDITVNNSMAVQNGATLNNVTITEANGYYGLWINGNGQTVTVNGGAINATNGGRGIKIADEYVDAPASVTLSVTDTVFNTAKKAAVLVSSTAGAAITASNVDITNVAEDSVNFVWVDEDWSTDYSKVTVTGGTVAQESIDSFTTAIVEDGKVVGYYKTLQAAVNAVKAGDNTIKLLTDISEDVIIKQVEGVNVVIDGNDKVYSGTFTIHGNARYTGEETLTFQNFKFETAEASHYFIDSNSTGSVERYAHNVTVKDSTFNATGAGVNSAVAMRIRQGFDIAIENVTATGMHSLLQAYGNAGITVNKVNVNGKNGISAGTSTNVVITNAEITATGYGIRADGSVATTMKVTDSKIDANQPIVVRENSNAAYNVTLENIDLNAPDGEYDVIFTTGKDDAEYVAPSHAANVSGAENLNVYPVHTAKIGDTYYTTIAKAIAAAQPGETVTILAGSYTTDVSVNKAITVEGERDAADKNLVNITGRVSVSTGATVKNLTVNNEKTGDYACALVVNGKDIVIDGCELSGYNAMKYCYAYGDVTIKNSKLTSQVWAIHFDGGADGNVVVDNCEVNGWIAFGGALDKVTLKDSEFTKGNNAGGRTYNKNVEITGCNFENGYKFDLATKETAVTVAESTMTGGTIEDIFHGNDVVDSNIVIDGEDLIYVARAGGKYYKTLQAAIDAQPDDGAVYFIYLNDDATGAGVVIDKNVNINFGNFTYTIDEPVGSTGTVSNGFQILNGNNVTLRNGTLKVADDAADKFYILVQNYADLTVDGMTLDGINLDKWSFTDGDSYVLSNNSGTVEVKGNTNITANNDGDKAFAFDVCKFNGYDAPVVNVNTTGKINGAIEVSEEIKNNLNISGGTFTVALEEEWCEEGYIPVDNGDGTYTVKVGQFVAHIGKQGYETLDEAFAAAKPGDEVEINVAGTYALSTSGKNITITGAVDGVVFDNIGAKNMGGANVTFNNVTFDYYPNAKYTGLQHSGNLVYNDCTFDGQVFLYGASETFNNCTFNQNSADAYNVWTYGAKEVKFNECTFNSAGKSVLIYNEGAAMFNDVTVTDCDFIACAPVDGKAAIEMDSSFTAGINLTIDAATTATGFGTGNVSGNSLWNNKMDNKTEANNDITVAVSGETVLAPLPLVAETNGIKYTSLQDAIDAAADGATVTLVADSTNGGVVVIDKDVIIDLAGKTYTVNKAVGSAGTETLGFQILKGNNVTIKNGTIAATTVTEGKPVKMLIQNYANLTLEDVTLDGTGSTEMLYVLSNNCGTTNITGNTNIIAPDGAVAFDVYDYTAGGYTVPTVNVNTTGKITGKIEVSDTATLAISGGTFTVEIEEGWCADGYGPIANADGTYGVAPVENIVATLNDRNYTSIAEAVEAATEADAEITVLAGHAVTETIVVDKSVTINLAGKALTADNVYPVIRVVNGATVTVTGNGSITNTDYIFVVGEAGGVSVGNLIIENGTFHGATTVASVTMGALIINGGYFSVDPYTGDGYANYNFLLNCIDTNYKDGTAKIFVKGGSFENYNPEDNAAETVGTSFVADGFEATTSNGSVWNVVPYGVVAKNEQTGKQFKTVSAALAAAQSGDTVTLLKDAEESYVVIAPGVTLDLQGYALTAERLVGFNGSYINAVTPKSDRLGGRLIIPKGNLILSEQALPKTAPYYLLPFWNDVGYYQFTQIALVDTDSKNVRGLKIEKENETIYFQFTHNASSFVDENLFVDGMDDNELEVVVHLEWTNDKGDAKQEFVYNNSQVGTVAVGINGQAYDYTFTLTNYSKLGIDDAALDTLKVYAMVRANSGATVFTQEWDLQKIM